MRFSVSGENDKILYITVRKPTQPEVVVDFRPVSVSGNYCLVMFFIFSFAVLQIQFKGN